MSAALRIGAMAILTVGASIPTGASARPSVQRLRAAVNRQFVALYSREYAWRNAQPPLDENTPKSGADAELPRVDEATQEAKLRYWREIDRKLLAIDRSALSPKAQEDYDVYKFQIKTLINDQVYKTYQRPLSGDTSFWGNLADLARGTFRTQADYQNYISLLNDFPRFFRENIDNMRAGMKRGFTVPRVVLQGRDATVASILAAPTPRENLYYRPFLTMPATMPQSMQTELRAEGLAAVCDAVIPAHQTLLTFLRNEYIPNAATSIAAYDLPDGKAFYRSQIVEYTTLDLSPEQIHQIGLDEVAKISAEMQRLMTEVGFKGSLQAFNVHLRTDPEFYATTPQQLLNLGAWISKQFDGKASEYFGRLPRSRFGIYPVPADVAPFFTGGRGGPGAYYINTYDLPSRPLYTIPVLTLHEAAPGHAFQIPLAAENIQLPSFRRDGYISAYGEGWALYCERLGDEMGIYETPYDRFGMLTYQMWRAARLVVDTGIHSEGWTRDQARRFLLDNTALSEHEITTEVDRYIAWPAQALSYYLGEMDIWRNRRKAEAALGDKFDIRAFHDAVLVTGSVPLPVLDTHMDRFIAGGGRSPYDGAGP
jgi:uncharacterized protein (DUF885 family)